jgi:hypothetical protein
MSVTFNGTRVDTSVSWGTRIVRTEDERAEDSVGFNMANGNASAFLRLLAIPLDDESGLCGSLPMADMVRAVQRARASFEYRVDAVTCAPSEGRGAQGCRFFSGGVDESYFVRRLAEFSELLADWIELGADGVSWG